MKFIFSNFLNLELDVIEVDAFLMAIGFGVRNNKQLPSNFVVIYGIDHTQKSGLINDHFPKLTYFFKFFAMTFKFDNFFTVRRGDSGHAR